MNYNRRIPQDGSYPGRAPGGHRISGDEVRGGRERSSCGRRRDARPDPRTRCTGNRFHCDDDDDGIIIIRRRARGWKTIKKPRRSPIDTS